MCLRYVFKYYLLCSYIRQLLLLLIVLSELMHIHLLRILYIFLRNTHVWTPICAVSHLTSVSNWSFESKNNDKINYNHLVCVSLLSKSIYSHKFVIMFTSKYSIFHIWTKTILYKIAWDRVAHTLLKVLETFSCNL